MNLGSGDETLYTKNGFNKSENKTIVPKFKVIASQCLPTLSINLLKFAYGGFIAVTAFLISELNKENAEISATRNELALYSSSLYTTPVGILLGGFSAQLLGSRVIFLATAVFCVTGSLVYYFAKNITTLLFAQAIIGISLGIFVGPSYTYVAEITQPQFRSILMGSINMSYLIGTFITSLLGNFIDWRLLVLVNAVFPILAFAIIIFAPESPYWLANNNKFHKAELSLAWYRGWTTPDVSRTEFLREFNQKIVSASLPKTLSGNIRAPKEPFGFKRIIAPFLHRTFYKPFKVIICINLIFALCGNGILQVYPTLIFRKIESPIDEHTATTILFASRFLGALFCIFSINLLGKRRLMFVSLSGGALFLTIVAIFHYLTKQTHLVSNIYYWISSVSIIIIMFTFSMGISQITYILNGELFPTNLRQISSSIGLFISLTLVAVVDQLFLYLVDAITLAGVILAFAIVNAIGLITTYFILPETEGKTVKEIEEFFSDNKEGPE